MSTEGVQCVHTPIPASKTASSFAVEKQHFQFLALPFGLAMAPWVCTKVASSMFALLRARSGANLDYLDNLLLREQSEWPQGQCATMLHVEQNFGWVLNLQKSTLNHCAAWSMWPCPKHDTGTCALSSGFGPFGPRCRNCIPLSIPLLPFAWGCWGWW